MVCELKAVLKYRGDHVLKTVISQSTINKLVKKQGFAERTTFERFSIECRNEFRVSYGFWCQTGRRAEINVQMCLKIC